MSRSCTRTNRTLRRLAWTAALGLTAAGLAAACTADKPKPKEPVGRTGNTATEPPVELVPPGLAVASLANLDSPEALVAFATGTNGALFAYVQGGKVYAKPVAAGPVVSADAAASLATVSNLSTFSMRARKDGSFILFWGERVDQNHIFKLLRVGADAKAMGSVLTLPPIAESGITFADVAVLGDRLMVVHEVTRGERMSVFVTPIAASLEKPEGAPRLVMEDVLGWYPAESESALAVVAIRADARVSADAAADPTLQRGLLDFTRIESDGKIGASKPILASPTAQIDAQIAAVKGGYVVAWTDLEDESAVRVATLSTDGSVTSGPEWIASPVGRQALVGITADPSGAGPRALLAWENVGQSVGTSRVIQLASIAAGGAIAPERSRLLFDDTDTPSIVADGDGFATLTLAPARPSESGDGDKVDSWPTLVRLTPDLSVRWSEPVRFAGAASPDGVPELAWNLSCNGTSCYALTADGAGPTKYYVVGSAERTSPWKAPAWRADDERPPKVLTLRNVASGPQIANADAANVAGDGSPQAIAWVTYFLEGTTPVDSAPKGEAPYAAMLGVRFHDAATGKLTDPVVISRRAVSLGGVSVTQSPGGKKAEAAIAWVAAEKGGAQVYTTRVDVDGKKVAQNKITTVSRSGGGGGGGAPKKGKEKPVAAGPGLVASSVAIVSSPAAVGKKDATVGDGFVVAWVDTRDKNGEVYAARLSKELNKAVADKRITNSVGDASDVSMAIRGAEVFIAFSDVRDGKSADIYFSHLDAHSLKELDDDGRVYASAGRSRAPHVTIVGGKILVAWIEEDAEGESKPATLRIGEVDATGKLIGTPRMLSAPSQSSVTGFTMACGASFDTCRLALSWATKDGHVELGAAALDASGSPSAVTRLGLLASGPFAEPSFSFGDSRGGSLYYSEDLGEAGRLRQLGLAW